MLVAVLIIILTLAAGGIAFFVALIIGIHNEPSYDELSVRAPTLLAALARRMLGATVRKPSAEHAGDDKAPEPWFAGAGYMPNRRDDEGR
jgi:hypothetical protein